VPFPKIEKRNFFFQFSGPIEKISIFQFLAPSFSFETFFGNISGFDNKVVPGSQIGTIYPQI